MCLILGVQRSGYYRWKNKRESVRENENKKISGIIKDIYKKHNKIYGSPKIREELCKIGYNVNHKRVERIMKKEGIRAKVVKKYRAVSYSNKESEFMPNILGRKFKWEKLNNAWVTDITYIWTKGGWVYLCVFLDLCSRSIVGWKVSGKMDKDLVVIVRM